MDKPIDGVVQALIEVAVGKVQHLYRGTCPDAIEGFDSRDPQCPACQVLTAAQQQGQAVAEDMGGFTSDTAALAFLHLIGNGNPNVERAVERLRQSLIAQSTQQGGGETIAGKFDREVLNPMRVADKQQGGGEAKWCEIHHHYKPCEHTAPPSAPVGVELSALRVQEWLHREHDILCPVQEIEQAMRTPCSCPFTERALAQQQGGRDHE